MGIRLDPWPIRARCPGCGEVTSHRVLSTTADRGERSVRCQSCGREWTWVRKRPDTVQRAESERRAKGPKRRKAVTCAWCGREFVPARDRQVCCSARCRERARRGGGAGLVLLAARAQRLERKLREVDECMTVS